MPLTPPDPAIAKGPKPHPVTTEDDFGESSVNVTQANPVVRGPTGAGASGSGGAGSDALLSGRPPSPPPKKGFLRRLRNLFLTLVVLPALMFGGGCWYSRINDNFRDFFTEFVPFGERAVLYLEEQQFKKRFPNAVRGQWKKNGDEPHVKVPAQSGASWRVADSSEPSGRQSTSARASSFASSKQTTDENQPIETKKSSPAQKTPQAEPSSTLKVADKATAERGDALKTATPPPSPKEFKAPEVNEPSKFPPLQPIDLMQLPDAKEPVVRDLVHMLNDLILVINADGAHGKYSNSVEKAKSEIVGVGGRISEMKDAVEKKAADKVRERIVDFDKAANELISRVEQAVMAQEMHWREEFESEMKMVRDSYDERVKLLMEREKAVNEAKLQNQLLAQAVALKKELTKGIETHVEQERESRLGKLEELSRAVSELEALTTGWSSVLDANIQTQRLHVAIDAICSSLEGSCNPRPFIRELVALKETAGDDGVIDAAIASINPSAYQHGIPTSSQLIERFRKVASEVRKASLLPDEAGVASHASSWVLSHVMFKKEGFAQGSDVESILTRAQTMLEEGDLDAATREMNGLQGWAKTLSKDWIAEARKVLEVRQALDVSTPTGRRWSARWNADVSICRRWPRRRGSRAFSSTEAGFWVVNPFPSVVILHIYTYLYMVECTKAQRLRRAGSRRPHL